MAERTRPLRAETRRRVLDAAFIVFTERGIAGSSLSQVAEQAGLTKGAVYSNFASKDELVLALMEGHVASRINAALTGFTDGTDLDQALAAAAAALVEGMRTDAAWHRLLAEYFAMAHHDPVRQEGLRQRRREMREAVTRVVERISEGFGIDMPIPAPEMAVVLLALSNGLAVEGEIDPEAVPADLLGRVLTLIAGDAVSRVRDASTRAVPPVGFEPTLEPF